MTHGKTYNKSPLRINHKATKSKTNTGTIALERSVEQTTGWFKALLQLAYFTRLSSEESVQLTHLIGLISLQYNCRFFPESTFRHFMQIISIGQSAE